MNGLRNLAAYAYFSPDDHPIPKIFLLAALVVRSLPKEAGGGARGELKGSEYFLEALLGRFLVIPRKGIKVLSCALFHLLAPVVSSLPSRSCVRNSGKSWLHPASGS